MEASSSIGRAPVSKTGGWGFDSLLACQPSLTLAGAAVSYGGQADAKVDLLRNEKDVAEEGTFDTVRAAAGGRIERARLFLSEVRNELKRVTWPTQKEVYATTVVVILVSIFFGLYLFVLDFGIDSLVIWIMRKFGVGA
jgi:preprotein translocase subunit SecE